MSLTLVKEDGTARADANTYALPADGDAYHAGHLYASAWTGATDDQKAAALVMATRLIDTQYQFNGTRVTTAQALQWPRARCPDPDGLDVVISALQAIPTRTVPYNVVPAVVMQATCETARALLIEDRTANPLGEGLKFTGMGAGQTSFDKSDRRPIIPYVAQAMLGKFGSLLLARSGYMRLVRV